MKNSVVLIWISQWLVKVETFLPVVILWVVYSWHWPFVCPILWKRRITKVLRWCKLQHQNDFKLMVKPIICVRSRAWSQLSQLVVFMKLQIVIMRSKYVHRVMPIYVWHVWVLLPSLPLFSFLTLATCKKMNWPSSLNFKRR